MILATYQPLNEDKGKRLKIVELEEKLGYYPYFCFSAENIYDVCLYSVLSAPNCPEKIIIFETDDFDTIDIIKWNQYMVTKNDDLLDDIINTDIDKKYKEFVVRKIDNVLNEISIDEVFDNNISFEGADKELKQFYQDIFTLSLHNAREQIDNIQILKDDKTTDDDINFALKRNKKNVFEIYLLPILYSFMMKGYDVCVFDYNKFHSLIGRITKMLTNIYNCKSDLLEYKTYEYYDSLCEMILSLIMDIRWIEKSQNIYPNDLCFCGSGKKYKKCHGKFLL